MTRTDATTELTAAHIDAILGIESFIKAYAKGPTCRELAKEMTFKVSKSTAAAIADELIEKGLAVRRKCGGGNHPKIVLTAEGMRVAFAQLD